MRALFWRREEGTASVLPMFILVGLLVAGGFSIDSAHLWQSGEAMRATADAAAHAGAVALSRGNDPQDAIAAAEQALGLNMDPGMFDGRDGKPRSDLVRAWHYDAASEQLSEDGPANAVSVQLRRGPLDGNAVPMYLLHLFGMPEWSTAATSVVALTPTTLCNNAAGLFARDTLTLGGEADIGAGFCLHSQSDVRMERRVGFEPGATVSMPDLARCDGKCRDAAQPGVAHEANFVTAPLGRAIGDLVGAMMQPGLEAPEKAAFFASRPIAEDLEPLAEIGIDASTLVTGAVVRMDVADFELLREVPQGLVYAVMCDLKSLEPPVLLIRGGMNGPVMDGMALVTNCALHFEDDVEVMGALLLSTYSGDLPAITAAPFAVLGDPSLTCDAAGQTQVMAYGDVSLPAGLILSNVALAIDGNVTLLPEENGALAQHRGFALHASGTIDLRGHHSFEACDQAALATLPALQVIRFVMPKVEAQPRVLQPKTKMPGKRPDRLESTPPLPMSRVPPERVMSQNAGADADVGL